MSKNGSTLMHGDLNIKAVIAGFFGYMLIFIVVMALVVHIRMPPNVTNQQALSRIAEADPQLLLWQNVLGTILGIFAGFVACHCSGAKGLKNSLVTGLLLILYGVVGIFMHPAHSMLMQVAKLVSPIPLVLLGGWLRLLMSRHS
jgi:hypothetical protein